MDTNITAAISAALSAAISARVFGVAISVQGVAQTTMAQVVMVQAMAGCCMLAHAMWEVVILPSVLA
jgi:hypothetical protein